MRSAVLKHLRSNVVGYLALFVALGGTSAYAANTVFSSDIVDGEVKTADLAPGGVNSAKILDGTVSWNDLATDSVTSTRVKNASLNGYDLVPNTVTGKEVLESSLGTVPDASTLGGLGPSKFIQGAGQVVDFHRTIALNDTEIVDLPGSIFFELLCASPNSHYSLQNNSISDVYKVWSDNGGADPYTVDLPTSTFMGGTSAWDATNAGDAFTFHLATTVRRITIWSFSQLYHDASTNTNKCVLTGQAVITNGLG
jgi:hypothetical protein